MKKSSLSRSDSNCMLPMRSFSDHLEGAPRCAQHQPTTLYRYATMKILFWDAATHASNTWRRPPAQPQRKATHVSGKIQLLPHSGLFPAGIRPSATVPCIARCLARIRTTIGAYSRYPLHHRWLYLPSTYHLLGLDDEDILSKVALNLPPAPSPTNHCLRDITSSRCKVQIISIRRLPR